MALLHKSYPDLNGIELSAGGIGSTVEPSLPFRSKNPIEIQIIVLFVFLHSWVRDCFLDIYFVCFVLFVLEGVKGKVYVFEHHKKQERYLSYPSCFLIRKTQMFNLRGRVP